VILPAGGGTIVLAQTTIFGNSQNGYFISNTGGTIKTLENNYVYDTHNQGVLTLVGQQ